MDTTGRRVENIGCIMLTSVKIAYWRKFFACQFWAKNAGDPPDKDVFRHDQQKPNLKRFLSMKNGITFAACFLSFVRITRRRKGQKCLKSKEGYHAHDRKPCCNSPVFYVNSAKSACRKPFRAPYFWANFASFATERRDA